MVASVPGSDRPPDGYRSLRLPVREAAWLLALAIFQVVGSTGAALQGEGRRPLDALAYLLLLAGPALLALRRRWPVAVLVSVLAITITYYGLGYARGPAFLSAFVALLSAVLAGFRMIAWLFGALALVAYFGLDTLLTGKPPSLASVAGHLAWLLLVLAVAEIVRIQRSRAEESRQARAEAERGRLSEERLRIARDLHDLLGHNMSLINVQASVALHLMDREPERARTALAAIKEASRDTLHEVREALQTLRGDGEAASREPAPGLARLSDLQKQFAAAGLEVTVTTKGEHVPLAPAVDLTAYRIAQEALTNVLRHSGARTADVLLVFGPDVLTLTITDHGRGPADRSRAADQGGSGIRGMRDRAASIGGVLSAAALPVGGFQVVATLPLPGMPSGGPSGRSGRTS